MNDIVERMRNRTLITEAKQPQKKEKRVGMSSIIDGVLRSISSNRINKNVAKKLKIDTVDGRYSLLNSQEGSKNKYFSDIGRFYGDKYINNSSNEKYKTFYEREYPAKRESFRKLAKQPEITEILETVAFEAIVDEDNTNRFCDVIIDKKMLEGKISNEYIGKFTDSVIRVFNQIINIHNFTDAKVAQGYMLDYLIDGKLVFLIVYDKNSLNSTRSIEDIVRIEPNHITLQPQPDGSMMYMYQSNEKEEPQFFKEHEIIYIDYSEKTASIDRTAYIERLIKHYNIYRILEQAHIIWHVTNSTPKMKYTVPIAGQNDYDAAQTLNIAMANFNEDISYDIDSGELLVKGKPNLPFSEDYWMAETDSGVFDVSVLDLNSADMSDFDKLQVWIRRMYKDADVPINRFDFDGDSSWWGSDAESMSYQERKFGNLLKFLRSNFSEIILKPLIIQLILIEPSLHYDKELIKSINLQYVKLSNFDLKIQMEQVRTIMEGVRDIRESAMYIDAEGNEQSWFSNQFLMETYAKLPESYIKRNAILKKKELAEIEEQRKKIAEEEASMESKLNDRIDSKFNQLFELITEKLNINES